MLHGPRAEMVWRKPWTVIRHEPHLAANLFEFLPCHYHLKCLFLKLIFFPLFFFLLVLIELP